MAFTIYSHGISVWFYIILDRYIWESIKICMHWLLDIYNLMEVLSHLNDGRLDTNLLDYSPYFVFLQPLEAQQEKSLKLISRFWVKSRQILAICRYPFFQCGFWAMIHLCFSEPGLFFSCCFIYFWFIYFLQIQDNIALLCQTRDNILRVLKEYVLH